MEPLDRSSRNFLCRSPVAVARSSSGGVAIRYVLPVLWMTSRLAVMGRMALRGRLNLEATITRGVALPARSLVSMNALFLMCDQCLLVGLVCMRDYKSLCAAATMCASLVNIQTHAQTQTDSILTSLYE